MKFPLLVAILSLSLTTPPAYAAVKIKPSKPKISGASQAGSGDQISDFVMNKTLIAIAGTIESDSTELVDSPSLGGSDGFLSALNKYKNINQDRLLILLKLEFKTEYQSLQPNFVK